MQGLPILKHAFSLPDVEKLRTNSTIGELSLTNVSLPLDSLGKEAAKTFTEHPMLSGILLVDSDLVNSAQFKGMISRQRFLEQMSRPYSLELFLDRPLYALYSFIGSSPLVLDHTTPIIDATQEALQRQTEFLYEPIVVRWNVNEYCLLDIHQLLIAHSEIHRLTLQLLHEKTQAHLVQTEKMSSLGRMVAGVSHEIKNPVNCVSGNLEFLKKYVEDLFTLVSAYQNAEASNDPHLRALEKKIDLEFLLQDMPQLIESMTMASERLVDIVSSLRNFSRMDHERKQRVDIHRYIDGTLLILDSRIKLGIAVKKDYGDIPLMSCYPGQMSQVFINIISNSVDALLEKESALKLNQGRLPDAAAEWYPTICISTRCQQTIDDPDGQEIVIRIWDNGDGIPDEIKDKVFNPFFTTKSVDHGTGLGLSISHEIVTQKHGGRISVESNRKDGTLFEIVLPCEKTNPATI
jgi:signal transduction histidine kinase